MPASTFDELIHYLKELQLNGRPRPVLLLGAGASKGAGLAAMEELFVRAGLDPKAADVRDQFCDHISRKTALDRYELLEKYLQTADPGIVTNGYQALANLLAECFFDLVLTANFDPLLDDALAFANLKRRHYVMLVNGVIRPERMNLLLSQPNPRLKIIKLHGDLFYRQMAWTVAEMDDYLEGIWPQLSAAVKGRDFLTVGYSLKDPRITNLVLEAGGKVWFTNYSEHPEHLDKQQRECLEEVVGPDCAFETLFMKLADALGVARPKAAPAKEEVVKKITAPGLRRRTAKRTAPEFAPPVKPAVPVALTVDDLLESLVGVWNPQFEGIGMTGFVLAEPRVIVVDGCMSDPGITGFEINEIVTSQGVHLPTKRIRLVPGDRFGPLLLEVPPELEVPGLKIDLAPVTAGLPIRIGVAVRHDPQSFEKKSKRKPGGQHPPVSFGLSTGQVISGQEQAMKLSGYQCNHVVDLECAVAPGASGAPVVDDQMAVRGFIIGGTDNLKKPLSLMFPASTWGHGVLGTK